MQSLTILLLIPAAGCTAAHLFKRQQTASQRAIFLPRLHEQFVVARLEIFANAQTDAGHLVCSFPCPWPSHGAKALVAPRASLPCGPARGTAPAQAQQAAAACREHVHQGQNQRAIAQQTPSLSRQLFGKSFFFLSEYLCLKNQTFFFFSFK